MFVMLFGKLYAQSMLISQDAYRETALCRWRPAGELHNRGILRLGWGRQSPTYLLSFSGSSAFLFCRIEANGPQDNIHNPSQTKVVESLYPHAGFDAITAPCVLARRVAGSRCSALTKTAPSMGGVSGSATCQTPRQKPDPQ